MRRVLEPVLICAVVIGFPAGGAAIGAQTPAQSDAASDIRLTTVPHNVYKVRDPGRGRTESWYFNLVVADAQERNDIHALRAELKVFAGPTLLEVLVLPAATLEQMKTTSYRVTPETEALSLRRRYSLDEVFDFRFGFVAKSAAWQADRVRITLTLGVPDAMTVAKTMDVPIRTYSQTTELIFPMRGPAIITQGQINNFGHAGHANQFAIDIMGLSSEYGPIVGGRSGNAQFAGWGRDVLAPADGTVVYVRSDVPDNAPDEDPRTVYSQVPEPLLASAGNCIIIDHGNDEFSALMHLQHGSPAVEVGSTVRQGQVIARLGNSGDAFGAHLHYQLQDGPELFRANSLPVMFENLEDFEPARGVYFEPR